MKSNHSRHTPLRDILWMRRLAAKRPGFAPLRMMLLAFGPPSKPPRRLAS